MKIKKYLRLTLFIGACLLTAMFGPKAVKRFQNLVNTRLQRSELAATAKSLRSDVEAGNKVPRPGRADELADYLRELRVAEKGGDVALDKWDRPFLLEWTHGREAILRSRGANGDRDACATEDLGSPDGDDICETIDFTPPKPSEMR